MKQKEIWVIKLDPTVGAEINKTRPCVILNDDSIGALPLKIIAPITDYKESYKNVPWMIKINPDKTNNLNKSSVIDTFQLRSVTEERLIRKIGIIDQTTFLKSLEAIKIVFGIE